MKTVTFPVPDDFVGHMKQLFQEKRKNDESGDINLDDTKGFVSDGNKAVGIYLSIVDDDGKF